MTSVVNTTVKFFTSRMPGAPVLTGQAGSLVAVLDACLKEGFGARPLTELTVAGGVATAKFATGGVPLVNSVVLVAGSSIAALNGEQRVVTASAGQVTFATAAANGTATGSITMRIAPSGWLKPFSDTNIGVYQSADPMSTKCLLRVDDTTVDVARVRGYENMSDANTGDGMFPGVSYLPDAVVWPKVYPGTSGAAGWTIVTDGRMCYFHAECFQSQSPSYGGYNVGALRGFGDLISARPGGDAYAYALSWTGANAYAYPQYGSFASSNSDTTQGCITLPRSYTGIGGPVFGGVRPMAGNSNEISGADTRFGPFPSQIDGALRLSELAVYESFEGNRPIRATAPGVQYLPHTATFTIAHHTQTPGAEALAGRSLLALAVSSQYSQANSDGRGTSMIDITGPWR